MSSEALELSAGGVVVREEEVLVIVPTRRAADGSRVLGLPKGHPEPGESALQAALREVREETGAQTRHLADLGEVHYRYERRGRTIQKTVIFFLLGYLEGDLDRHDHEVERAFWLPLVRAQDVLTYAGEREMIARALAFSRASR